MLSHTGRRNLFGTLTQNTTTTNLTTADTLINASEKRLLGLYQWRFLDRTDTVSTTTAQFYGIPQRIGKLTGISVTVDGVTYTPKELSSEYDWAVLNAVSTSASIPTHFFTRGKEVGLYPVPTGGATITFYGREIPKDLSIADYTTGSVVSIANGGTAVVGTGTTWTTKMAGRYIRITDSSTANTGDGYWYPIASVGSATALTLGRPYQGTAISAGTASYTIGQMSLLPEEYHELPVYDAVKTYFASIQPDMGKYQVYDQQTRQMELKLINDYATHSGNWNLMSDKGIIYS